MQCPQYVLDNEKCSGELKFSIYLLYPRIIRWKYMGLFSKRGSMSARSRIM